MSPPEARPIAGVVWHSGELTRAHRWATLGTRGGTLWLTGLPGSGKSTLAAAVERRLVEQGVPAYRLDGDNLRHDLNAGLGFSPQDRAENVRRVAAVARLLADAGLVAVACLISPYAEGRRAARRQHQEAGLTFVEVHVATPLYECERRDPKGLYARGRAGVVRGVTGIDHPYEVPQSPELRLEGDEELASAVASVLGLLAERGWDLS